MSNLYELASHRIQALLQDWQARRISEKHVHEAAETLFEELPPVQLPRNDRRSVIREVLSTLENLNNQWVTPEDVPAIMAFMRAAEGKELEAWKIWEDYWSNVDYTGRREQVRSNPYYSQTGPHT